MHVVILTSGITPYTRNGQIADVCAALPKALRGMDHKVSVVSPLWSGIEPAAHSLARRLSTLHAELKGEVIECSLYDGRTTGGVELLFIGHDDYFGRHEHERPGGDAAQSVDAALVFAQAAAAQTKTLDGEVVHAHGGFAAFSLCAMRATLPEISRVLSLYGEASTLVPTDELATLQLPDPLQAALQEAAGDLVAAGSACAERVVVGSQLEADALAQEAMFRGRPELLLGITPGVDYARWNPMTDPALVARFDPVDRTGRARCKDALQYEWELPVVPDAPVLLVFGVPDAGGDAAALAEQILQNDVQLVVVQPSGEEEAEEERGIRAMRELSERFADRMAVLDSIDEATEHRLIAGADLVLIHEAQAARGELHLRALRYGALPIARNVSAMAETLVDCDAKLETGNGFVYTEDSAEEVLACTRRALAAYANREAFETLRQRVMELDLSWERSARRYEHCYKSLRAQREQ